jgi:hypothetical protein
MMIAQFSFLIALGMLAVFVVGVTWEKPRLRPLGILAAVAIVGGWWLARPGAGGADDDEAVAAALAGGRPVVVEVYSDY